MPSFIVYHNRRALSHPDTSSSRNPFVSISHPHNQKDTLCPTVLENQVRTIYDPFALFLCRFVLFLMICLDYPLLQSLDPMHGGTHQSLGVNPEVDGLRFSDLVSAQH
jgi:hypothetical protein